MVIAVTGATGFVGNHVMRLISAGGQAVRALVRTPARLTATGVTAIRGDLHDAAALAALCDGASAVLHMAGAISGPADHMMRVNGAGTAALLRAADRAGVGRFVHVSSLAAREPNLSPYGYSKARAEEEVNAAARSIHTLIIRPSAVYGEGDLATLPLLKALLAKTAILPGHPESRFSLIHAEDLARILVDAVASEVVGLREVDDGHGAYRWIDVADVMRGLTGRPRNVTFLPRLAAMLVGQAGDALSAFTRKPLMVYAGKMRELYHVDWVARPPGWPRENHITLRDGLHRTLTHAMALGQLPHLPLADRSPVP
ncbi:MAG: NAD(P)-dependent oxidoreductase [Phyllobacteriaceae bacterium]|nr:NAD(P)-dependent oxidoreductase [Phyllobacteriaceae bacterium]